MSVYKQRKECAICSNEDLHTILDYGDVPLAGYFPCESELEKEELFDLNVLFCEKCSLVQTDSIIDADKLFLDYRYMSSIGLSGHFTEVAEMLKDRFSLDGNSVVVEIGSNDGVLLKPLKDIGIDAIGFEPAVNIAKVAREKGVNVINDYFNADNSFKYLRKSSVDLFVSNNCFAHIDDIKSIVEGIRYALKDGGHFVFEVSYVRDLINKLQYDNIYHEHIYYYSLTALYNMFRVFDMTIVNCEFIPIHSGSIRVTVKNAKVDIPTDVNYIMWDEYDDGLTKLGWYEEFSQKTNDHCGMITAKLVELNKAGFRVAGYGASGRANMVCNICDIDTSLVEFIVDESPERAGRYIPGKKIPIVPKSALDDADIDYIVIFAWNFADMIMKKLEGRGYKFIVFFPEMKVFE